MSDQPQFNPEDFLQRDIKKILGANDDAQAHLAHTGNIDEAGDKVEKAVRDLVRRKFPAHYVGQGHVAEAGGPPSPQLDIMIGDRGRLFFFSRSDDEDGADVVSYNPIYAIGAVRITYTGKQDIREFLDALDYLKSKFRRAEEYWRPLFSFMFFVRSKPRRDLIVKHIRELYASRTLSDVPNAICFLDKGLVIYETIFSGMPTTISVRPQFAGMIGGRYRWVLNSYGTDESRASAANLGVLYEMLGMHLAICSGHIANTPWLNPSYKLRAQDMITEEKQKGSSPMRVESFALCESAALIDGRPSIQGVFDAISAPRVPLISRPFSIVVRMRFSRIEAGIHTATIRIVDEDGKPIVAPYEDSLEVIIGPEIPSDVGHLILQLSGLRFERFGEYAINLTIDGREEGSLPFFVKQGR